jgi:octaprenyl-diphosphate synthase
MLLLGEQQAGVQAMLEGELAGIEIRFAAELRSDLECVNELAIHLEQYSGLAIEPERELTEAHRVLATVVEMVHMATLVHDDVLDDQDIRRRATTINRLRGNEMAVMLGDYLISHAYHLCSSLQSQSAARLVAAATNTVCEGELLQLSNRMNWELDEPTYFQIIRRKTAALCGVSCHLGAAVAGGSAQSAQALERYGEHVGTAFQIIDDVLDLTGDPAVVGKSLGKDLEKGKLTLPLIHHLATAEPAERQRLMPLLQRADHDAGHEIVKLLAAGSSLHYARHEAERLVGLAKEELARLPDSPARSCLLSMAEAVITRQA